MDKKLTKEQALQKAKQFCAYQERCHSEVKEKLYGYGLYTKEVEAVLAILVEENYLNEERFATAYAGGKFRMKQWGKVKITHALKLRQVSAYCIKKALAAIPEEDYLQSLQQLLAEKKKTLKSEKNIFIKKHKLKAFLLQKGYEANLVNEYLQEKNN